MKNYRRTLWMTLTVALVAMLAAVSLSAQGPGGRSGRGGEMGPGQGRGFGGPGLMLQRLNLTHTQREQIRAIVREQREGEAPRKMAELHRELRTAIFADTPDHGRIEQLKASLAEAQSAALASRIDTQLKVAEVLTPEQRAQARELAEGKRGRGAGRGARTR